MKAEFITGVRTPDPISRVVEYHFQVKRWVHRLNLIYNAVVQVHILNYPPDIVLGLQE